MKYGFVIDNRKCIGCHACTTACKAEHEVPVGVNRTWVKQVEKGQFPHVRRIFSVMRCNHCSEAPCVEICPVEALFIRDDGIVDFDKRRCIGCKSCMQACPYDALYIDPDTHTAAKCNYCAHRIDIGLEPACVNVCPEHAIISGDMDNPDSEIALLLKSEQVTVRSPEKETLPNVYYINGDSLSLNPSETDKGKDYAWSAQAGGVGHYARAADKLAWSNPDVLASLLDQQDHAQQTPKKPVKSIELQLQGFVTNKRVYDVPDKGILWGWEVPAYVVTKAISTGLFLLGTYAHSAGVLNRTGMIWSLVLSVLFLIITGGLLVKDLDRPDRFLYVLLRPQWRSWLTRGGYAITVFGGLLFLQLAGLWIGWEQMAAIVGWINVPVAILVSVYTAFLFAQAKGRDFWQNPILPVHMLVHSVIGGAAALIVLRELHVIEMVFPLLAEQFLLGGLLVHLIVLLAEFVLKHGSPDAAKVSGFILRGPYALRFWGGVVLLGIVVPCVTLSLTPVGPVHAIAALVAIAGMYVVEQIWIEAPQRIALS